MLHLDSLCALPINVVFCILNEWLPLHSLGRLDSATLGTKKRNDYLHVLSVPGHIYCAEYGSNGYFVENYMKWVMLRSVKVSNIQFPPIYALPSKDVSTAFFLCTGRFLKQIKSDSDLPEVYPCIQAKCRALETLVLCEVASVLNVLKLLISCQATIREVEFTRTVDSREVLSAFNLWCPNMHTVNLRGSGFPQYFTTTLVHGCPNLVNLRTHLTVSFVMRREPEGLAYANNMVHEYVHLRELDVSGTSVTNVGIGRLVSHCPNLTRIVARKMKALTATGIIAVTNTCKQLTEIILDHNAALNDQCLEAIAENCSATLTKLSIARCNLVTCAGVSAVTTQCRLLRCLDIQSTRLRGEQLQDCLMHCTALEELNIENVVVTDVVLSGIAAHCPALTHLSMQHVTGYSSSGLFAFIQAATQLRELTVSRDCTVVNHLCKLLIEQLYPGLKVSGVAESGYVPNVPNADDNFVMGEQL